jgi:hypothetical protein
MASPMWVREANAEGGGAHLLRQQGGRATDLGRGGCLRFEGVQLPPVLFLICQYAGEQPICTHISRFQDILRALEIKMHVIVTGRIHASRQLLDNVC